MLVVLLADVRARQGRFGEARELVARGRRSAGAGTERELLLVATDLRLRLRAGEPTDGVRGEMLALLERVENLGPERQHVRSAAHVGLAWIAIEHGEDASEHLATAYAAAVDSRDMPLIAGARRRRRGRAGGGRAGGGRGGARRRRGDPRQRRPDRERRPGAHGLARRDPRRARVRGRLRARPRARARGRGAPDRPRPGARPGARRRVGRAARTPPAGRPSRPACRVRGRRPGRRAAERGRRRRAA